MRMQDLLGSNRISSRVSKDAEPAHSADESKPLTQAGSSDLGPEDLEGTSGSPVKAEGASGISPAAGKLCCLHSGQLCVVVARC